MNASTSGASAIVGPSSSAVQPLPPGWRMAFTSDNRPYYMNDTTVYSICTLMIPDIIVHWTCYYLIEHIPYDVCIENHTLGSSFSIAWFISCQWRHTPICTTTKCVESYICIIATSTSTAAATTSVIHASATPATYGSAVTFACKFSFYTLHSYNTIVDRSSLSRIQHILTIYKSMNLVFTFCRYQMSRRSMC